MDVNRIPDINQKDLIQLTVSEGSAYCNLPHVLAPNFIIVWCVIEDSYFYNSGHETERGI